jgi:hypothetical protein
MGADCAGSRLSHVGAECDASAVADVCTYSDAGELNL